jgi:hypothetical protein
VAEKAVDKISVVLSQFFYGPNEYIHVAATAILSALGADEERHVFHVQDGVWVMQHPLIERLDNSLLSCTMHNELNSMDFMPDGMYWIEALPDNTFSVVEKKS